MSVTVNTSVAGGDSGSGTTTTTVSADVKPYYFSGATDAIVQLGPGTSYDIFLSSFPNLATVTVYDNTSGTNSVKLNTVTNSSGGTLVNYTIPIGTPPTYGVHLSAIRLVTTGTTVGLINYGE